MSLFDRLKLNNWTVGKKMVAGVIGIAVQFIPVIPADTRHWIGVLITGFVVGQGFSDIGKEAEIVRAKAAAAGISIPNPPTDPTVKTVVAKIP